MFVPPARVAGAPCTLHARSRGLTLRTERGAGRSLLRGAWHRARTSPQRLRRAVCTGFRWLGRGRGSRVPAPRRDIRGALPAAPPPRLSPPPSDLRTFQPFPPPVPILLCIPWGTGGNCVSCTRPARTVSAVSIGFVLAIAVHRSRCVCTGLCACVHVSCVSVCIGTVCTGIWVPACGCGSCSRPYAISSPVSRTNSTVRASGT